MSNGSAFYNNKNNNKDSRFMICDCKSVWEKTGFCVEFSILYNNVNIWFYFFDLTGYNEVDAE